MMHIEQGSQKKRGKEEESRKRRARNYVRYEIDQREEGGGGRAKARNSAQDNLFAWEDDKKRKE